MILNYIIYIVYYLLIVIQIMTHESIFVDKVLNNKNILNRYFM
jgi:hypothetical protein